MLQKSLYSITEQKIMQNCAEWFGKVLAIWATFVKNPTRDIVEQDLEVVAVAVKLKMPRQQQM